MIWVPGIWAVCWIRGMIANGSWFAARSVMCRPVIWKLAAFNNTKCWALVVKERIVKTPVALRHETMGKKWRFPLSLLGHLSSEWLSKWKHSSVCILFLWCFPFKFHVFPKLSIIYFPYFTSDSFILHLPFSVWMGIPVTVVFQLERTC